MSENFICKKKTIIYLNYFKLLNYAILFDASPAQVARNEEILYCVFLYAGPSKFLVIRCSKYCAQIIFAIMRSDVFINQVTGKRNLRRCLVPLPVSLVLRKCHCDCQCLI